MSKVKRALIVLSLAAVPLLGPIGPGSAAFAADPPGLAKAKAVVVAAKAKAVVVAAKKRIPRPRAAPAPLLGVGLPAFALAGAAFAGYRSWRRRRPEV